MDMKECYAKFGGDYEGVLGRLMKEERIIKYAGKFVKGNDYQLIVDSLDAGDMETAFRNVHNLKGVSLNLGFTPLHQTSDILCEALRHGNPPVAPEEVSRMLQDVKAAYDSVVSVLKEALPEV